MASTFSLENETLMTFFHVGLDEPLYSRMPWNTNNCTLEQYIIYALLLNLSTPERPLILLVISESAPVQIHPESATVQTISESTPVSAQALKPTPECTPVQVKSESTPVLVPAPESANFIKFSPQSTTVQTNSESVPITEFSYESAPTPEFSKAFVLSPDSASEHTLTPESSS